MRFYAQIKRISVGIAALVILLAGWLGPLRAQPHPASYRISAGDQLLIQKKGESDQAVLVPPDGRIPISGGIIVDVLGKTLAQAAREMESRYLADTGTPASFTVIPLARNPENVVVLGAVEAPGPQPEGNLSL